MKKRVEIHISNGRDVSLSPGKGNYQGSYSQEMLSKVLGKQPSKYVVVYTLAPKTGKFSVRRSGFVRVGLNDQEDDWQVCQIPDSWVGERCNRRVVK